MAKKHETNVELLTRVMEYSKSGPIMQAVVVDLLCKAAKELANTPIEDLRKAFGEHWIVSPEAWHEAAKELNKDLRKAFGEHWIVSPEAWHEAAKELNKELSLKYGA